jgi:Abnormal spindle-like microcephaly-assoc'd, ASPM-SPD-2-Hydin/Transmembrane protein 131-like N-terminal
MRGTLSQSPSRGRAVRHPFASQEFFVGAAILFTAILSGCASSTVKSSAEPASAKISVVPSIIDFKSVVVGQKNSQALTITNKGVDSFSLDQLRVSGTGFTLSSVMTPAVIAPGKNISLSVVFSPTSASATNGALIVNSSDLKAPLSVPLSGSGEKAAPQLQVSPAAVSFGSQAVNSSAFQSVTLTNTGNASLAISSVSLGSPVFSVTGLASGVSISPNQKLQFQVWFHPAAAGNSSASLTVSSGSLSTPVKLAITGSATATASSAPSPGATSHSVTLGWNASTSSVTGYQIYRGGSSGGPYNRISGSIIGSLTYKDASVLSGDHYYYVVTAVEADGSESAYSNEVAVEIPSS